jgi:Cu(I)/Ag(I) efflux system periplasmic protein CusF
MKPYALLALVFGAAFMMSGCERDPQPVPGTDPQPLTPTEPATPAPAQPAPVQPAAPPTADTVHAATGTVAGVDPDAGVITINHDPVDSLGWPPMMMNFAIENPERLEELKLQKGDRIEFTFVDAGANRYVIQDLQRG